MSCVCVFMYEWLNKRSAWSLSLLHKLIIKKRRFFASQHVIINKRYPQPLPPLLSNSYFVDFRNLDQFSGFFVVKWYIRLPSINASSSSSVFSAVLFPPLPNPTTVFFVCSLVFHVLEYYDDVTTILHTWSVER